MCSCEAFVGRSIEEEGEVYELGNLLAGLWNGMRRDERRTYGNDQVIAVNDADLRFHAERGLSSLLYKGRVLRGLMYLLNKG